MRGRIAGLVAALSLIAGAVGVLCAAILAGIAAPTGPQILAQRGSGRRRSGRCRGRARGRRVLLDGPGGAAAPARRLYGRHHVARIPAGAEGRHARPHRHDLFRMGRLAPSADHRAVADGRRAGIGRRLLRRYRPGALYAGLAHLDLVGAAVRRAAVRRQRLSRHPAGDRRVGRRRQQQRAAGHGGARRGAGQGHHHQRPADPVEAAEFQHAWISTSSTSISRIA